MEAITAANGVFDDKTNPTPDSAGNLEWDSFSFTGYVLFAVRVQ